MGLFGGSNNGKLLKGFYKAALENKKLDELCAIEAGANTSDILRDSDFYVGSAKNNGKSLDKLDSFFVSYVCYLPGRMVWVGEHVYASKIESLFEKEALKDINEENAHEAINSVFNKVCEKPDLLFQNFNPSFIYYKKIDVCRFLHEDDGSKIQIRVGDFQYLIPYVVGQTSRIENCRTHLFDRDDLRFIQLQISEANLRS